MPPCRRQILSSFIAALGFPSASRGAARQLRLAGDRERASYARFRAAGSFPVSTANPLSLSTPEQKKNLLVRVTYPDPSAPSDGKPFPVVLFSHDFGSSKDQYIRIAEHWASHGFITIQPTHIDSQSLGYKSGAQEQIDVLLSRAADMAFLLGHLEDIAMQSPALSGRLAMDRIAAGGHGFGALTALALAGLPLKTAKGEVAVLRDNRIGAIITISGIGPLPVTSDDWSTVKLPVLASSGTNDPGVAPNGDLASWRWHLAAYDRTAGSPRYGVSIAGGDHHFGGGIGREQTGEHPDAEGLAAVNALSAAFLAATFGPNAAAKHLLEAGDIAALSRDRAFVETASD